MFKIHFIINESEIFIVERILNTCCFAKFSRERKAKFDYIRSYTYIYPLRYKSKDSLYNHHVKSGLKVLTLKIRHCVRALDRTQESCDTCVAMCTRCYCIQTYRTFSYVYPRACPARGTRPMKGISANVVHDCSHIGIHV